VPVLILSGGEPLLRRDIFDISARAKDLGFFLCLSSNGTSIDAPMADRIAAAGYDYVGVSLDGHRRDARPRPPQAAPSTPRSQGLRLLRDRGVKVGVRFTMTQDNESQLEPMIDLCEAERFPKFYLSHLVYAGRGNKNRGRDSNGQTTRRAMDMLIDRAEGAAIATARDLEIVTGNNDADAVYLLHWAQRTIPNAQRRCARGWCLGRQRLRRQRRQHRQSRQGASRHDVVAPHARQCEGPAVLGDLDRSCPIRSSPG
jgi:hypothetical protein